MAIFETHFHFKQEWDAEKYYNEALEAGVEYFLAVGAEKTSSLEAESFAAKFANAYFAPGVHPHDASDYLGDISDFANLADNKKCVAIGEIGLDYFYENSDKKSQLIVFEKFLNLALDLNLPAIIHCRDKDDSDSAYSATFDILKPFSENGGQFVVHCFSGSISWAEKFLDLGAYLGVTGIVTFPRAQNIRDLIDVIPLKSLLLETDAPYLAPVPFRGKVNNSKYLPFIRDAVAKIKNISSEEVEKQTTLNALNLFKIN